MAAQDLCSLSDVKAALETTDASRDTIISTLITAASDTIMDDYGREFAPATASATRRFQLNDWTLNLEPYDLRSTTSVTLHPESTSPVTLATTDFQLLPIGAPTGTYTSVAFSQFLAQVFGGSIFAFGYALVDIAGAWGFATVPTNVNRACVLTVSSWLRRDVMAFLLSSEVTLGRGLAPSLPSSFSIPADARKLLDPFARLSQQVAV